jgi:hypothetical protein
MTIEPMSMSLFDVENVEEMPKVRDMIVAPVSNSDVTEFGNRYHYTGTGGSALWRWGLWDGPVLHGVVAYNLPTRPVCESVFGPDHFDKVWHMGRLILSEDSPRNSESRLIGGSIKEIARNHANVWAILTYAATDAGHVGYVYQATNAIYTGHSSVEDYFVDADGNIRNRRNLYEVSDRTIDQRAESIGWRRVKGGVKHRYVYILGSKTQRRQRRALLRYPVLPYPKAVSA